MRSKAIKLDVKFAEAKACGRLDRPFAVTCLALLRQTCATHTQKELLASIADAYGCQARPAPHPNPNPSLNPNPNHNL